MTLDFIMGLKITQSVIIPPPTPPQTKFGGYIGITLSVRPSMYLVNATPPKRLIGFL
jgi:hypothetical protein